LWFLAASAILYAGEPAPHTAPHTNWSAYLGGPDSSQYSALKQINETNLKQLEIALTYPTGEKGSYLFNPIVIDNVMYVVAKNNSIVALDAAIGQELWAHANTGAVGTRGISYWETKDRSDRRLLFVNAGFLTAIDARR
jgi:quinoprotein glucose dehydrogenase